MKPHPPSILSTVSMGFIEDWIDALAVLKPPAQLAPLLAHAGLGAQQRNIATRVTLDQIVRLYQRAAVETGDEMMGLWGRPIRPRALQHLLTSVRAAGSLPSALYRFSTFWNLLLDDYQFELEETPDAFVLALKPQGDGAVQRFGHMLILKLAHGLLSWLAGHEVPVKAVGFAFEKPSFAEDYAIVFPAPILFGAQCTTLSFDSRVMGPVGARSDQDLDDFLQNAPRDWIFTRSLEHTQALKLRSFLVRAPWPKATLTQAARALNMTPRTLIRRLEDEGTSFQTIKDGLRRDIAIRDLQAGQKTIEDIAQEVGFSSAANFHRAFRRWTGSPPSLYRRGR